jgi:hypothetical protein
MMISIMVEPGGIQAVQRYTRRQSSSNGGDIGSSDCLSVFFFRGVLSLNSLIAVLGWQAISNRRFCLRKRNLERREKSLCSRTGSEQSEPVNQLQRASVPE